MNDDDFKQDELINVKLPRGDLEIVRKVIEREKAYNWLTITLKSSWIWVVAGGAIAMLTLSDKFITLFTGK